MYIGTWRYSYATIDSTDSPHLYEMGLMRRGQYYSSLCFDRISEFQLCSKFRTQIGWGLWGGFPILRAGGVCELLEEEGGIISGPVASCQGGTNLLPREGNLIGAGRMASDAENTQVDAVAKIIFRPYCSAAMESLISV